MGLNYYQCELCFADLMFRNELNANKLPPVRRFRDDSSQNELLSVRCAECVNLPYKIEKGQPFRTVLLGSDDVNVHHGTNNDYHYWSRGLGHLLEVYGKSPSDEVIRDVESASFSIGFLVEEEVNLIVLAYRIENIGWNATPYQWYRYEKWESAIPPENPESEREREFTVAIIDTDGGKYRAIRKGILPFDFATSFHRAIAEQIAKGAPDWQKYAGRLENWYELLDEKKLIPALRAHCFI